jgi:hypothetical protein
MSAGEREGRGETVIGRDGGGERASERARERERETIETTLGSRPVLPLNPKH